MGHHHHSTSKTPAHTITPVTASKTWKENLRRACLDRARQRCRLLDYEETASPAVKNIRQIIEEELREQSVAIRAPCFSDAQTDHNHQKNGDSSSAENSMMALDHAGPDNEHDAFENTKEREAQHYISEEDLYELMYELEQEMEREQAFLVDDVLQEAENERRYLEEQVTDYEQWEEIMHPQSNDVVPCPVCHEENLVLTDDGRTIICPNTMDELCSLIIPCSVSTGNTNELTTLHDLQSRLRQAYEAHSLRCHHFLTFHVRDGQLCAYCLACAGSEQLV